MSEIKHLNFNEMRKYADQISKATVYCKCGHGSVFSIQTDRIICSYCGHYVYRTPQLEFEYKLKEKMRGKKLERL